MKKLLTVGLLAKQLGCPVWKVVYILKSRHIEPAQRAGHLRVFSPDVVDVLRRELNGIERRRKLA